MGVNIFGSWNIVAHRTKGGQAMNKHWAILSTSIHAIHIEMVEEFNNSSFVNTLRRFIAIRGDVKELRSDRGYNYFGAIHMLGINRVCVGVKQFLYKRVAMWTCNPPHFSHMGGV